MVDEAFSRATAFKAHMRSLEAQLAAETSKRIAAEQKMGGLELQIRSLLTRIASMEGQKAVGIKKRLVEDEIRISKQYQELLEENDRLRDEQETMKKDKVALSEAAERGKSKLQHQLESMLDEALLLPSRREYYARLVKELNIDTLMLLQRDMKFFDDQN